MKKNLLLGCVLMCFSCFGAQAKEKAKEKSEITPTKEVVYKTVGEVDLKLHLFEPSGHQASDQTPAIIFFHDGGWKSGDVRQFYPQSQYLASRGMVAICAEYRVEKTHKISPKECVMDGKSAMRWVRGHAKDLGIDPDKLAAGGGGAGGHIAAATALVSDFNQPGEDTSVNCQPNLLVLFNPTIDNGPKGGYGYDRVKSYWKAFSPIELIDKEAPPTIIFLGSKDKQIPVKTAEKFQKLMKKSGVLCELQIYEDAPHSFFKSPKYKGIIAEVDRFLVDFGFLEKPKKSKK